MASADATQSNGAANGGNSSSTLRPRLSARERSNSFRRKASIDIGTGQPHHYDHRRYHHHDPTKGRSPSPPQGAQRLTASDKQDIYKYNSEGVLVQQRPTAVVEQSWASFLIQHQLVLSFSMIAAVFAAHTLILSKEARDGHSVDWVASLSAIIPPPIWRRLPLSVTNAPLGVPAVVKKWTLKPGAYDPNEAWSSLAMALQYQQVVVDEATGLTQVLYGKGWKDLYMVAVWVMIWTAFREAAMTYVFIPMGRYFRVGEQKKKVKKIETSSATATADMRTKTVQESTAMTIQQKKEEHAREGKLLRFAEQGWLVLYDGFMWSFGIYLLYHSQYWSDTTYYWRDYPKTQLDATAKWYYLIQFAFWIQQLLLAILGIEKRRKDFLEFMIHHIITCLLIGFSYSFNLTSVGHAVLCAMDFSDIVLAACKMLKYMHKDQIADVGFVFFVITWVLSRHYYYGVICWSTFVEAPKFAEMGWDPARGLYFTQRILSGFQFLLIALYIVLLFWLVMIIRVVVKVLKGGNSEDVRSEDEDEEEVEAEIEEMKEAKALLKDDSIPSIDEKIRSSVATGTPVMVS
ncbi:sphingosine N-acyltransferase lag1 [Dissophora ornata]|nr:sphingosine N-acyltransferase lag1 [Dissophora ornata]